MIAKRSEMKRNSGHASKANFGSDICEFESSHPSQPVRSLRCNIRVFSGMRVVIYPDAKPLAPRTGAIVPLVEKTATVGPPLWSATCRGQGRGYFALNG